MGKPPSEEPAAREIVGLRNDLAKLQDLHTGLGNDLDRLTAAIERCRADLAEATIALQRQSRKGSDTGNRLLPP